MKRLFDLSLLVMLLGCVGSAQAAETAYTNDGTATQYYSNTGTSLDSPPIDAINFINNGTFIASNATPFALYAFNYFAQLLPYETSSTLNYTNTGVMAGSVGFRFDNAPSGTGQRRASRSFFNDINATVEGQTHLYIWATNIINRGTLRVGSSGLVDVTGGGTVDLAESQVVVSRVAGSDQFGFGGSFTFMTNWFFPDEGIYDLYWSITNLTFATSFDVRDLWAPVRSGTNDIDVAMAGDVFSPMQASAGFSFFIPGFPIPVFGSNWVTDTNLVVGTNIFNGNLVYANTNVASVTNIIADSEVNFQLTQITLTNQSLLPSTLLLVPSNVVKQAVFVCVPDGFSAQIGFENDFFGIGNAGNLEPKTATVLFSVNTTNLASATLETNTLFFSDALASTPGRTLLRNYITGNTYRPTNYVVQRSPDFFGNPGTNGNSGYPATNFFLSTGFASLTNGMAAGIGTETPVNTFISTNGAYAAYSAYIDNVSTRAPNIAAATYTNLPGRIEIKAGNLDLQESVLSAQSWISLKAKHLVSSTNAFLDSESFSFDLASTNGTLTLRDLVPETVTGRIKGPIRAWSAVWTNTVQMFLTNNYADNGAGVPVLTPYVHDVQVVYHALILDASSLASTLPTYVYDLTTHARHVDVQNSMTVVRNFLFDASSLTIHSNLTLAGAYPVNPSTGTNALGTAIRDWTAANAPKLVYFTNLATITIPNTAQFGNDRPQYLAFQNNGAINADSIQVNSLYLENQGALNSGSKVDLQFTTALLTNGSTTASNLARFTGNHLILANHTLSTGDKLEINVNSVLSDWGMSNTLATRNGFTLSLKPMSGDLLATTITDYSAKLGSSTILHRWAAQDRGATVEGFSNNAAIGHLILSAASTGAKFRFSGTGSGNALYVDRLDFEDTLANQDGSGNMTNVLIDANIRIYYAQAVASGLSIAEKLNGRNGGRFIWTSNYAGIFSSTNLTIGGTNYLFNQALAESTTLDSDNDGVVNAVDFTPIPLDWAFTNRVAQPVIPALPFPMEGGSGSGTGFAGVKGAYNGLFYVADGLTPETSGYFTASTTDKGGYSGKLTLGGKAYSFSGQFDAAGRATNHISKAGVTAELLLNLAGGDKITGQIAGGDWDATLLANRTVFSKKTNPAPVEGKYTLIIKGGGSNSPAGHGYGTVSVDASGNVKFSGTLADGTKVSQNSALSAQSTWPLYVSLYKGTGNLVGWVRFSNEIQTDLSGQVIWMKPAISGTYYPGGFNVDTIMLGALYSGTPNVTNGVALFTDGNLSDPITSNFVLDKGFKASNQGTNRLSLQINSSTGLFKGKVYDPDGNPISYSGAWLKKSRVGAGFFLGLDESGQVVLSLMP